jgi:hypothetical protein
LKMIRSVLAAFLFFGLLISGASAQGCSVPNTFVSGTTASASQVNANFAALLSCVNSPSFTSFSAPQGRLTLAANTPVMTPTSCSASACSAQGTLRYDCYVGAQVPYYTGTVDALDTVASCEVTDVMVSAASAGQVVSGQVYDVWWVHGGANHICLAMSSATGGGGGWAFDTSGSNIARGLGYTQLDRVTRAYITNKNSIANCFNNSSNYGPVSANQATYLGTVYASGSGQISYNFPALGAPPIAGLFGVFNAYNRVTTTGLLGEQIATYTYGSTTIRECHGDTTYNVQFVLGLQEDAVIAMSQQEAVSDASGNSLIAGIGLDNPNMNAVISLVGRGVTAASIQGPVIANYSGQLLGFHTLSCNESVSAASTITIVGGPTSGTQTGMTVTLRN